jgi:hypothetical protein
MEDSSEKLSGIWFSWDNCIKVKVPEMIKREIENIENKKNENTRKSHKSGFGILKKFVSFATLLVLGYNTITLPKALLGKEFKTGFVDGNKKTEFLIDRKYSHSLSGEGLYSVLDLDSGTKYDVVEIKNNLENKIKSLYARDVLSFAANNKKIVVKKDFNNNYFLDDLFSKKEIKLDLNSNEEVTDLYIGKRTYLSCKDNSKNFSKILVYDDNFKKIGNVEFYTGLSSVKDFEVKEERKGVESILIALDNNQIRTIRKVGNKYEFADIWKMDYLKNDVVSCATEVGSYIMFGTENGKIGFFKKNDVNEVYFLKLKEEDKFPVKELKINNISYDKKTNKTTVNFTAVRNYGMVEYSVKL